LAFPSAQPREVKQKIHYQFQPKTTDDQGILSGIFVGMQVMNMALANLRKTNC
jgi:hypothetical protein